MTIEDRITHITTLDQDLDRIGKLVDGIVADRTILLAALRQIRELAGEDMKGDMRFARILVAADAALRKCQHVP